MRPSRPPQASGRTRARSWRSCTRARPHRLCPATCSRTSPLRTRLSFGAAACRREDRARRSRAPQHSCSNLELPNHREEALVEGLVPPAPKRRKHCVSRRTSDARAPMRGSRAWTQAVQHESSCSSVAAGTVSGPNSRANSRRAECACRANTELHPATCASDRAVATVGAWGRACASGAPLACAKPRSCISLSPCASSAPLVVRVRRQRRDLRRGAHVPLGHGTWRGTGIVAGLDLRTASGIIASGVRSRLSSARRPLATTE